MVSIASADADGDAANGHRVALSVATVIAVTLTSGDGSRVKSYRMRVEEPPCPTGLATGRANGVTSTGASVNDLARCPRERALVTFSCWLGQFWLLSAPDTYEFLIRQFHHSIINCLSVDVPVTAWTTTGQTASAQARWATRESSIVSSLPGPWAGLQRLHGERSSWQVC